MHYIQAPNLPQQCWAATTYLKTNICEAMTNDPSQALNVTSLAVDELKLEEKAKETVRNPQIPLTIYPSPNMVQ